MNHVWYANVVWIIAVAALAFAVSAVFAGLLRLPRTLFLVPYVGFVGLFLCTFVRWSGLDIGDRIRHQWVWGLVAAVVLAVFTVNNVVSQPKSPRPKGLALAGELLWSGVVYGVIDALLLSVVPVVATWQTFSELNWTAAWYGRIAAGIAAVFASLVVTLAYHLGYPEYRGRVLVGPVIGNTAMTVGYLVTNNPLAAVISHVAMHVAGVLHGPASVVQLPPHYRPHREK
jgi:hypothetical protein